MQQEPPHGAFEVSPPSPEERRAAPDGLGWPLIASLLGHGSVALFLLLPRCGAWITGTIEPYEEPEPAYTVIPIDAETYARLVGEGMADPPDEDGVVPGADARARDVKSADRDVKGADRDVKGADRLREDPRAKRIDEPEAVEPETPEEPSVESPPEPLPLPHEVRYRRFLHVDDGLAADEDVTDADYIGARDAEPAKETRAPVTADLAGPRVPLVQSAPSLPAKARPETRQGDPEAPRDGSSGGADAEGGPMGASAGAGAPGTDGDGEQGGQAAPRSVASERGDVSAASEGLVGTDPGLARVPDGDAAPGDGLPVAARAASEASAATATDGDAVAVVERAEDGADRGGSDATSDERAAPSEARRPSDGTGAADDPARGSDPVADLREALGWGAVDIDDARGSPGSPASAGQPGGAPSSPQGVVLDDVEIGYVSWARVADDPVGRYTEIVYDIVRARWHERDLSPDAKALGIQGRVTVEFVVYRNGRVSAPAVTRDSGQPEIDALALAAIPDRLPKFPRDLHADSVPQRITFTYSNDLISGEQP